MGKWLKDKFGITQKSKEVGHGAYGSVLSAVCPATGQQLAVKVQMARPIDAKALRHEQGCLALLKDCPHPNVVQLLDHFMDEAGGYAALVMPAGMCDLRKFQHLASQQLPTELTVSLSRDLCAGLRHIHGLNILHRDIKPANLLVFINSGSTTLKLSDFGNSRIRPQHGATTPGHCTAWYRPPEMFALLAPVGRRRGGFGPSIDMWSCGCVIGEMILGVILFDGDTEPETVEAMAERLGQPLPGDLPPGTPALTRAAASSTRQPRPKLAEMALPIGRLLLAEGLDLIRCCLDWHPARRITAVECMRHSFLRGVDEPAAAANVSQAGRREQPAAATAALPVGVVAAVLAATPVMKPAEASAQRQAGEPLERPDGGNLPSGPRQWQVQKPPWVRRLVACRCMGYCAQGHGELTCERPRIPNGQFCSGCTCMASDVDAGSGGRAPDYPSDCKSTGGSRCFRMRSRSQFCYKHLYLSLPRELQVVRLFGQMGLLMLMIPCDVEQLLASRHKFGKDVVLLFIAAWLKEPAAIKALAKFKPTKNDYTATDLMRSLHAVSPPYGCQVFVEF